jgi:integrase
MKMSGFVLTRTLNDGTKSYECRVVIKGKQRSRTFRLKKDANDWVARHLTSVNDGSYRPLKRNGRATFDEFIAEWKVIELTPQKLKASTINGYGSYVAHHIAPHFKGYAIAAIDLSEVTRFESRLLQKVGQSTTRSILILLKSLFTYARKHDYIRVNPMDDHDLLSANHQQVGRALNPDEIGKLLAQCSPKLRPIVLIALLAGLRKSEIFALHWTDSKMSPRSFINFENDVIAVRQMVYFRHGKYQTREEDEPAWIFDRPKSEKSIRDVPLSGALKRELLELRLRSKDKQGLIFQTKNGTPQDPNNMTRKFPKNENDDAQRMYLQTVNFQRAVHQADIGACRFHDLRHTYGSMKLDQGENMYDVMRWMGHSSIQVTIDTYGHRINDRGKEAAERTDQLLGLSQAVASE